MVGRDLKGADIQFEIRQHIDDVPRDADPVFPGDFKTHGCTEMFTLYRKIYSRKGLFSSGFDEMSWLGKVFVNLSLHLGSAGFY
jgi:hypothetical protein